MKTKPLMTALLTMAICLSAHATQAAELAVCHHEHDAPALFDVLYCQDTARALTNGKSSQYQTTLYQLYAQGWRIVATQAKMQSSSTVYTRVYLEKSP